MLSASLPAITVVNPLVWIRLGALVFDENLRQTAPAILGEVVFLGVLALPAVNLPRLEQLPAAAPAPGVSG